MLLGVILDAVLKKYNTVHEAEGFERGIVRFNDMYSFTNSPQCVPAPGYNLVADFIAETGIIHFCVPG